MTVQELRSILDHLPGHTQVRIDTAHDECEAHVIEYTQRNDGVLVIGVVNCGYAGVDVLFDETEPEPVYERPVTPSAPI